MRPATAAGAVFEIAKAAPGQDIPASDPRQPLNQSDFRISSALRQGFEAVYGVGTPHLWGIHLC